MHAAAPEVSQEGLLLEVLLNIAAVQVPPIAPVQASGLPTAPQGQAVGWCCCLTRLKLTRGAVLLQAFESFDKSSLAALEISQEELLLKLRLTALMALSSKSHVVSFQAVQQALGLQSNAEVEQWIVRAIGKVRLESWPLSITWEVRPVRWGAVRNCRKGLCRTLVR